MATKTKQQTTKNPTGAERVKKMDVPGKWVAVLLGNGVFHLVRMEDKHHGYTLNGESIMYALYMSNAGQRGELVSLVSANEARLLASL